MRGAPGTARGARPRKTIGSRRAQAEAQGGEKLGDGRAESRRIRVSACPRRSREAYRSFAPTVVASPGEAQLRCGGIRGAGGPRAPSAPRAGRSHPSRRLRALQSHPDAHTPGVPLTRPELGTEPVTFPQGRPLRIPPRRRSPGGSRWRPRPGAFASGGSWEAGRPQRRPRGGMGRARTGEQPHLGAPGDSSPRWPPSVSPSGSDVSAADRAEGATWPRGRGTRARCGVTVGTGPSPPGEEGAARGATRSAGPGPGPVGGDAARRRRGQGRRGRRRAARGEPARRLGLPRPGRARAAPRCLHFSGRRRGSA